jgi:hypothetical protein
LQVRRSVILASASIHVALNLGIRYTGERKANRRKYPNANPIDDRCAQTRNHGHVSWNAPRPPSPNQYHEEGVARQTSRSDLLPHHTGKAARRPSEAV